MEHKLSQDINIYNDNGGENKVKTVYDRIKELCKAHNITISELENKLGFSRSYLIKWKTTSPSADKLAMVADFFGVSLDYLYSGKDTNDMDFDTDIISIQRARRKMPEKDRIRMMKMLHIAFEEAFKNGDGNQEE